MQTRAVLIKKREGTRRTREGRSRYQAEDEEGRGGGVGHVVAHRRGRDPAYRFE